MTVPRPEGYTEDEKLVAGMSPSAAREVYGNIASACESGWDFSSRWLSADEKGQYSLKTARTKYIVPVDLNSYLCLNEQILAKFYNTLGMKEKAIQYIEKARKREAMISDLMWNETLGVWLDYDMKSRTHNVNFYPSNVSPMFAGCYGNDEKSRKEFKEAKVVKYLQGQGMLDWPGGVSTSKIHSGQQWDYPDAWPPLVHGLVSSLSQASLPAAKQMAYNLSQKWLRSNWLAWKRTGKMYEKYDATRAGEAGSGGEYAVQEGFGWTNGVVLQLLADYGKQASVEVQHLSSAEHSVTSVNPLYIFLDVFALCFIIAMLIKTVAYCRKPSLHYIRVKSSSL